MLKKLALIALTAISAFAMHNAEININDKDLELSLNLDMGQFNDTLDTDSTYLGISYLKASDEHSDAIIDTTGFYELNFLVKREVSDTGITFGIGVKANYTKVQEESFSTFPLGVEAEYVLPTKLPIGFGGSLYYAPESLAFADANGFLEYKLEGRVEVIDRGSIIIGYRNINTDFKVDGTKYDINYNTSGYFGFRFDF